MNEDGINVDYTNFDNALARTLIESKRTIPEVLHTQARGVIRQIVGITPPSHIIKSQAPDGSDNSTVVIGGDAKQHGEAKVESDIRKIYGTPSDAYALMEVSASHHGMEDAFYRACKKGEMDRAASIFRATTGKSFSPFDAGAAHQRLFKPRGRVGRLKAPLFYVNDEAALKAYIKTIKARVGWLAAGWNQACAMLGVQPPQWIWRHAAPGRGELIIEETVLTIKLTNSVKFSGSIADWERKIQRALDEQAKAMQRTSADFMEKLFKRNGFKQAA